jgi:hypothetical protein
MLPSVLEVAAMLSEEIVKECAEKLREIFDGIEVEGSTISYKGQWIVSRGWIWGAEGGRCDPAIFVKGCKENIMLLESDREMMEISTRLLTYAIASIVAHETVGESGDLLIYGDNWRVIIEIGSARYSWLSLEFPYISPNENIRSYKIEVRLYSEGGLKIETISEFAPTNFETLRKIVALYLL